MSSRYYEKYVHINLTTGAITPSKELCETAQQMIGGRGLAAHILQDGFCASDPFSPEHRLVCMTGPFTTSIGPSAGRYCIAGISPADHRFRASSSSGIWGTALKCAGIDGLILDGKASSLSCLYIEDNHITLVPAGELAGKMTDETDRILKKQYGSDANVLCIGPAGEALDHHAAIINDLERAAGRNGLGAVLGSQNIKAIVVRSSRNDLSPLIYDPEKLERLNREISARFASKSSPACSRCRIFCGRTRSGETDPEIIRCNRLGIDADGSGRKADPSHKRKQSFFRNASPQDLYFNALLDSLGLCMFAGQFLTIEFLAGALQAVTGIPRSSDDLLQVGQEICRLESNAR